MFEKEIRRKSEELLETKTVDMVIGYTSGSLPFQARPVLISSPERYRATGVESLLQPQFSSLSFALPG